MVRDYVVTMIRINQNIKLNRKQFIELPHENKTTHTNMDNVYLSLESDSFDFD